MSAIAGVLEFHGRPVTPGTLERMTAHMKESGPDGASHGYRGSVALGHRLLRTRDGVSRPQPRENASGSLCIVIDGRLDAIDSLRVDLRAAGVMERLEDDADLVLQAYGVWGTRCTSHLRGEFAFAIWDASQQRLFCAVDGFAACQLYYIQRPRFFAFASSEEALLTLPGVDALPDDEMIAQMLVADLPPRDLAASWIRDVRTLRPAQSVQVSAQADVSLETYWRLRVPTNASSWTEEEAQERFLQLFENAVRRRTPESQPPSLMLSGGMDSASICAMLRRASPHSALRTYSAVSDAPGECAESQSILHLSRGADAKFVSVPSFTGSVTAGDLVHEAWSGAHPRDNSLLLPALMCLAARRNGDRVMLHGVSGDATLRVPARYPAQFLKAGELRHAWRECVEASTNNTYLRGVNPASLFLANAWTAWAPGRLRAATRFAGAPAFGMGSIRVSAALEGRLGIRQRLAERNDAANRSRTITTTEPEDLVASLYGPNGLALGLAGFGKLGKRYGLDLRDPWADRDVVEFMLALPLHQKIRHGWNKYFVRAALRSELDPQVLWRKDKAHLGWLFTQRVLQESRPVLDDAFGRDLGLAEPYIDLSQARTQYRLYLAAANSSEPGMHAIRQYVYDVAVLVQWLKRLARAGKVG
jgi:asparagine synthase (glutamine-hydrolysing)